MRHLTSVVLALLLAGSMGQPVTAQRTDSAGFWTLHLDSRSLIPADEIIRTWGLSVGRIWGPKAREVTLGYYWLAPSGARELNRGIRENAQQNGLDSYRYLYPRYVFAGYWHNFINTQQWKVGIPLEAGVGQAMFKEFSVAGTGPGVPSERYLLVPVQLSGYVEWKATRWIGFGLQTGYHWELKKHPEVPDLDGMFYRIRLMTYIDLYYDLRDSVFKGKRLRSPFWPMQ